MTPPPRKTTGRDLDAPVTDGDFASGKWVPTAEEAERAAAAATDRLVAAMDAQANQVQSDRHNRLHRTDSTPRGTLDGAGSPVGDDAGRASGPGRKRGSLGVSQGAEGQQNTTERLNDQVADLARQTAQLFIRQASALEAGDVTAADALGEQIAALTARHARLMRQKRTAALPTTGTNRPQREVAADVLREVGFAVPVRFLSDLSVSLDGVGIPLTNFGALRRAEQAGYSRNPQRRPSWMVPGINAEVYTANAKWITMSNWNLTDRIITEHTGLAGALRCLLHTADRLERVPAGSPVAERLTALAYRISYGLPTLGADPSEGLRGVLKRAREHLQRVAPLEEQLREQAADTLHDWPVEVQMWGRDSLTAADKASPYSSERRIATGTEERR